MDRNLKTGDRSVNRNSGRAALTMAIGIVMLLGWTIAMLGMEKAPGWSHLFLTLGVFLLILGIVLSDRGGDA